MSTSWIINNYNKYKIFPFTFVSLIIPVIFGSNETIEMNLLVTNIFVTNTLNQSGLKSMGNSHTPAKRSEMKCVVLSTNNYWKFQLLLVYYLEILIETNQKLLLVNPFKMFKEPGNLAWFPRLWIGNFLPEWRWKIPITKENKSTAESLYTVTM